MLPQFFETALEEKFHSLGIDIVEAIHEKVRKPYPEKNLEILFSEHDQQSGIYGSGIFAHEKIKGIN